MYNVLYQLSEIFALTNLQNTIISLKELLNFGKESIFCIPHLETWELILEQIRTMFSTSWGLWRRTVLAAWNTSTSPCWITCSMQALAPQYTPARDWPSLQGKRKYNLILAGKIDWHFSRQFTQILQCTPKWFFQGKRKYNLIWAEKTKWCFSRRIAALINVNQI